MPHIKGTDFLDKLLPNEDNAPHTGGEDFRSVNTLLLLRNEYLLMKNGTTSRCNWRCHILSWFHDFMIMWPSTITKDVISWIIIWLGINVLISHCLKKGKVLKWVNPCTHRAGVEAPTNLLPCPMFSRGGRWWYTVTRCISDEPSLWPFSISCAVFFL